MGVVGRVFLYFLKRALWLVIVSTTFSSLRLALSQQSLEDDMMMMGSDTTNDTNSCATYIDVPCEELPAMCLDCAVPNCTYGTMTEYTCAPKESAQCNDTDLKNITRIAVCQYCYQLPEQDTSCTANTTCDVRGSNSRYISNCTACDDVLCIPPRNFKKQVRCNRTGQRWSTAFLLSFTLGGFGVDRFYLQHWGSACGKLISFGGLGVWSILDVILIGTGYLGPADGSSYVY